MRSEREGIDFQPCGRVFKAGISALVLVLENLYVVRPPTVTIVHRKVVSGLLRCIFTFINYKMGMGVCSECQIITNILIMKSLIVKLVISY